MKSQNFKLCVSALAGFALALSATAFAEQADRDKPVNLEADSVTMDDASKVGTYQGNVQLSQGTLLIRADKLVVKEDANGFQQGTAYGNPASFRQKREGYDEYVEGYGTRIEYDAKNEKVELFGNARLKRGQDEVRGNYISYDAKTEYFRVLGGGKEAAPPGRDHGRVHAVIQPKTKAEKVKPAPSPVPLKESDSVAQPPAE